MAEYYYRFRMQDRFFVRAVFFSPGDLGVYTDFRDTIAAPNPSGMDPIASIDRGSNMFGGIGQSLYSVDPCDTERCGSVLWEAQDQDEDYSHRLRPCGLIVEADEDGLIEDDLGLLAPVYTYGYVRLYVEEFGEEWFEGAQIQGGYGTESTEFAFENALLARDRFDLSGSWKGHTMLVTRETPEGRTL